jgi:hypothetical protein
MFRTGRRHLEGQPETNGTETTCDKRAVNLAGARITEEARTIRRRIVRLWLGGMRGRPPGKEDACGVMADLADEARGKPFTCLVYKL